MSEAKTDGGPAGANGAGATSTSAGASGSSSAADSKAYNLGLSDTAGHKGAITLNDNAPIESVILAYQVVRRLAEHVSSRVKAHFGECDVVMHNPADFVALSELRSFFAASEEYKRIFNELIQAASAPSAGVPHKAGIAAELVLPIVGGIINSVLQVFSLFRSDEDVKNYKIEVEDQVLAMTVAGRLVAAKCRVVSSAVVPADPLRASNVLVKLQDLRKLHADLATLLDKLNAPQSGSSAEHDSAKDESAAKDPKRADLIARIGEALKSYDTFEQGLAKLDDKTANTPLSRIMAVENFEELLKKDVCILWVKAVAAGGGSHAKVSTFNNQLTYSGGAVVCYAIFDNTGVLKEADTVPMYGGKLTVKSLPDGNTLGLAPYGYEEKPASPPPPPPQTEAEKKAAQNPP